MIDPTPRPSRAPWWHALAFVAVGALAGGGVAYAAVPRGTRAASTTPSSSGTTTTSTATTTAATVPPSTGATTTTAPPTTAPPSTSTTTTTAPAPTLPATAAPPPLASTTTTAADTDVGSGPVDPQHPCAALTVAEVGAATRADDLVALVTDQRCRYRTAAGTDRAVVTVSGYPSADVARNGLRDVRRTLADTTRATCTHVDAGDEALVCEPTLGPVAAVGLVRVGATVVRIDLFGTPPAGAAALLLERAASRV